MLTHLIALLAVREGYENVEEMLNAPGEYRPAICRRCHHTMSVLAETKTTCDECDGELITAEK